MTVDATSYQSDESGDGQMMAIVTAQGVRWMICSRGVCLYDESGTRLMRRYAALRLEQRITRTG